MLDLIKTGLRAMAEIFGWKREQANRMNSPEMRDAENAAKDSETVDNAREIVEKKKLKDVRRGLS